MATVYEYRIEVIGSDQASGPLGNVNSSLGNLLLIAGGGILASAILGIGRALQDMAGGALSAAAGFQESMSRIAGLTNTTSAEFATMRTAVLDLSKVVPQSADELAKGLYFVVSAGFQGADAMNILTASAKAAAAGLGTTATVTDAVTSVLNAYKLGAGDAAHVTDIMVNAVVQGKMPADALAGAIGRVLPIAAAAGVSFEQVAASMATMTRTGLSADEASTALRGTLQALEKPTAQTAKGLAAIGLSAHQVQDEIKNKGLLATLQDLVTRANDVASGTGAAASGIGALGEKAEGVKQHIGTLTETIDTQTKSLKLEQERLALQIGYWGENDIRVKQHEISIEKLSTSLEKNKNALANLTEQLGSNTTAQTGSNTASETALEILGHIIPNVRALTGVLSTAVSQGDAYKQILDSMAAAAGRTDKAFAIASQNFNFQIDVLKNGLTALAITASAELFPKLAPALLSITQLLTSPAMAEAARGFGRWLGDGVTVAIGSIQLAIQWVQHLADLFNGGLADGLTPLRAIQSVLSTLVPPAFLSDLKFIFDIFVNIGDAVARFFGLFRAGLALGFGPLEALRNTLQLMLPPELFALVQRFAGVFNAVADVVGRFIGLFRSGLALGYGPLEALRNTLAIMLPPDVFALIQNFFGLLNKGGMWITGVLVPALLKFAAIAGPQLGAGLNQLAVWLGQIFQWGVQLAQFALPILAKAFQLAGDNMQIVVPVLGAIAAVLGLLLAPIIAIPALILLFATAWANNWGGIQEKTAAVWAVLQPILAGIGNFIGNVIVPAVMQMAQWLGTNVPVAMGAVNNGWIALQPAFLKMQDIVKEVTRIVTLLVGIYLSTKKIIDDVTGSLLLLVEKFVYGNTQVTTASGNLDAFGGALNTLGGGIVTFIQYQLGQFLQGLQQLSDLLSGVADWLKKIADYLANIQLPDWLKRHSPSQFELALMNSNVYLKEMANLLPSSLGKMQGFSLGAGGLGAGSGGGYSGGQGQGRNIIINGPIHVTANDARAFHKSLLVELGTLVYGEADFLG